MKKVGIVFGVIAAFVLLIGLSIAARFGGGWLNAQYIRIIGTQTESARTDMYRENKSYVEGTVRDLREMQVEYLKASDEHKDALRSLILHRSRELDWDRLPSDVRNFLEDLN